VIVMVYVVILLCSVLMLKFFLLFLCILWMYIFVIKHFITFSISWTLYLWSLVYAHKPMYVFLKAHLDLAYIPFFFLNEFIPMS